MEHGDLRIELDKAKKGLTVRDRRDSVEYCELAYRAFTQRVRRWSEPITPGGHVNVPVYLMARVIGMQQHDVTCAAIHYTRKFDSLAASAPIWNGRKTGDKNYFYFRMYTFTRVWGRIVRLAMDGRWPDDPKMLHLFVENDTHDGCRRREVVAYVKSGLWRPASQDEEMRKARFEV